LAARAKIVLIPICASCETHSTVASKSSPEVTTATSTSRAPTFSSTPGSLASATKAALTLALCGSIASASLSTTKSSQLVSQSSSASALPKRPRPMTNTFFGFMETLG
jgi:hypothetical protein